MGFRDALDGLTNFLDRTGVGSWIQGHVGGRGSNSGFYQPPGSVSGQYPYSPPPAGQAVSGTLLVLIVIGGLALIVAMRQK